MGALLIIDLHSVNVRRRSGSLQQSRQGEIILDYLVLVLEVILFRAY